MTGPAGRPRSRLAKRLLDVGLVLLSLPLSLPLLALLALLVRLRIGRPVLFRQIRPGLGGRPFWLCKLRTMNEARGADGALLPDAERLSPFGRLLRSTSLDELPELWNVLKGEMSLVGPRPLLVAYLPLYTPEQARRHEVPPGITGWAQVNGLRGETDTPEKMRARVQHDLYYIDNWSLMFDLKILMLTPFHGFVNRNAY